MSIWADTPRISGPPDTQDIGVILGYVKDLANTVAKMEKDLEFLVNGNLDVNNIQANSIETKNLKANSIGLYADRIFFLIYIDISLVNSQEPEYLMA
ncbi:hypothetical protein [Paenibacillus solani]|uniref:hypothetical protein n=1 Tax=Paenibacillus solani TaxID=1705565 RepID=UPI003D2D5A9C